MRKVGISLYPFIDKYGEAGALEAARRAGADAVDFNLSAKRCDYRKADSVYSKSDDEIYEHFNALREVASELGIEVYMTHGRLSTFKNDPENDAAVLENARRDCLATRALGAKYCVMHGVTTCNFAPDTPREFMHELNYSFFSQALRFAEENDIYIATETFGDAPNFGCCDFFGNADEFKTFFDRVRAECEYGNRLVMCVDTGHSNKAMRFNNNPTPANVIRMLGSEIKCLHLNDNDTFLDQHRMPGMGSIDWNDVFAALDEVGYNGVYNMELNLASLGKDFIDEYAAFAIKYLKNLLCLRYGDN